MYSFTLQQVLEKLPAELKAQQRNHAAVAERLARESKTWLLQLPELRLSADSFVLHWCALSTFSCLMHTKQY